MWEDQSKHPQSVSSGVSGLTPSHGQFLQKRQVTTTLLASRKFLADPLYSAQRRSSWRSKILPGKVSHKTTNTGARLAPWISSRIFCIFRGQGPCTTFPCCGGLTLPTSELGRPPKIGPYLMAGRELTSSLTCQTIATSHYLALVHSVHAYDLFWEAMSPILLGTNQCHHTFSLFFLL